MNRFLLILSVLTMGIFVSCKEDVDSNPPTCEISSPADGEQFRVGQNVTVIVDAAGIDNLLKEVRFYLGSYLLSIDREAPYRYVWETDGLNAGSYELEAVAYDEDLNKTADNITVSLYVEQDTIPLEFITVLGGTFEMGCTEEQEGCFDNETPVHTVTVDGFLMSKYEITNFQYAVFLNAIDINESGNVGEVQYIDIAAQNCEIKYSNGVFLPKVGGENFPVVEVSWYGAQAFCVFHGGRLPTEAEWEFAARGGNDTVATMFAGNADVNVVAWYFANSSMSTHEVGTKFPNQLGLHDMSGNVFEWCADWYSADYYAESPELNPTGPTEGVNRVLRGGIWNGAARFCRVSYRADTYPIITHNGNGMRMVKDLE